ncbi:MAG: hypothetical protein GY906_24440 [bacterium]|nr:hypothetical protein [bacterium]
MGLIERFLGPNIDKLVAAHDTKKLGELLQHSKGEIRLRAVRALAGLDDARVVGPLIGALGDSDDSVADSATEALRHYGDRAVVGLEDALGNEDENIATRALKLLLRPDPPNVDPFVSALKTGNDRARVVAAETLIGFLPSLAEEESREECFRAMRAALGDRDPDIRALVADGLGKVADERASKALVAQLKDGTETVREACSEAIQHLGTPAIPYLVDALGDRNANARSGAARLLGLLSDAIVDDMRFTVVERLQGVTSDGEAKVAENATEALKQLGAVTLDD